MKREGRTAYSAAAAIRLERSGDSYRERRSCRLPFHCRSTAQRMAKTLLETCRRDDGRDGYKDRYDDCDRSRSIPAPASVQPKPWARRAKAAPRRRRRRRRVMPPARSVKKLSALRRRPGHRVAAGRHAFEANESRVKHRLIRSVRLVRKRAGPARRCGHKARPQPSSLGASRRRLARVEVFLIAYDAGISLKNSSSSSIAARGRGRAPQRRRRAAAVHSRRRRRRPDHDRGRAARLVSDDQRASRPIMIVATTDNTASFAIEAAATSAARAKRRGNGLATSFERDHAS